MIDRGLIADADFFRALSGEGLDTVLSIIDRRELRRGDVLFDEGQAANELFIVETGRIAIANKSVDGRSSLVALMERGDLFGEMSLFDELGRSAEARALEASSIYAVPYSPLRDLLHSRPELLWGIVELMARRLRSMDEVLADSVFLDVTGRTAKRLLELAGDAEEFQLPITQEELAGMVGASRERVNKAIASFINLRWIEQIDRRYRIIDRAQLEQRSR